ncbi:hypothetical protein [Streptomyces sp. NPDC005955]|uniref:hypothetical protein n=1 Tax=Streptomyces sp. NPDC005955 TaxID=3364738 RepID=UPI00368075E8
MTMNEWKFNPHTDTIQYLGGWLTDPTYRGCIVRENSGRRAGTWAVRPRDPWTEVDHTAMYAETMEAARAALENVTPGGHRCEVFVSQYLGHCPERASVVTYSGIGDQFRGILLCPVHSVKVLVGDPRMSVERWEAKCGAITHESGPIVGDRVTPPMAPVRRSDFLSRPVVWGDDWEGYTLGMKLAQRIVRGDLVMFHGTGAFEVNSVDVVPIPLDEPLYRFNCNGGATYGGTYNCAVPVLNPPL